MLFVLGFFFIFVIGGLTGVMLASVPFDLQVHDTFFVVAHLHYVLIGGAVFPLFGAFYYWFPKITGRMLSERLGQVALLALLHRLERHVLPDAHPRARRHAAARLHLPAGDGLGRPQPARDASARAIIAASVLVFLDQRRRSACATARSPATTRGERRDARVGDVLAAAAVQLRRTCPVVEGRYAALEPERAPRRWSPACAATGARSSITTSLDAEPDHRHASPGPTIWPFVAGGGDRRHLHRADLHAVGRCRSAGSLIAVRRSLPGHGRAGRPKKDPVILERGL